MAKIFEADIFRDMAGNNILDAKMTNPMTTAGDIIYGGTDGLPTRLPKGTDNQYLKLVSGVPAWADATGGSGTSLWTAIAGTRASNTSFTVTSDITTLAVKGLIIKWTESSNVRCAMVVSSTFSSPNTTVNICGDTMASIDSGSLKYTFLTSENARFVTAGTIGATGTDVTNSWMSRRAYRLIGFEIFCKTAGTTNSTTVSIINANGTVTLGSPSLATTVSNNSTPTAPATSGLSIAIGDRLYQNITGVQSTPCVDLYVDAIVFESRFLTLT